MAVKPQDMMDLMKADQGMGGEPATPPAFEQEETTAPMASPMSTPEPARQRQDHQWR